MKVVLHVDGIDNECVTVKS